MTIKKETTKYSVILEVTTQEKLAKTAKQFKISQHDVLEVLINFMDMKTMGPLFQSIRNEKVARREQKKNIIKKLKNLDADKLAAIEEMTEQ